MHNNRKTLQKLLFKDVEQIKASNPQAMSQPFTSDEIRTAIMKLKNKKSAGLDGIVAELLKYGPDIICDEIALIYNP